MIPSIDLYRLRFSALHCNRQKGLVAPHKALMLMTVLDCIEDGSLTRNCIVPSKPFVDRFVDYWDLYVPKESAFKPSWENPFWHLQYDGFWTIKCLSGDAVLQLVEKAPRRSEIEDLGLYAVLEEGLWDLLQNGVARDALRGVLISTYLCQDLIDMAAEGEARYGVKCCPFCQRTEDLILQSEISKAFYDLYPVSRGHSLIVPKRHVADYHDLSREEKADMWDMEDMLKELLKAEFRPDGFNVGVNIGRAAGQGMMHVHLHVIPRYWGDMDDPKGGVRGVILC